MKKKAKLLVSAALVLAVLAGLTALRGYLARQEEAAAAKSSRQYAAEAAADHPARLWYAAQYPEKEVLAACAADLTADGLEDMVVIYRAAGSAAEAVALLQLPEGGYLVTAPTPAPQQHQKMRFFNMDHDPELEFLMTGDKDGQVGYAVYRVEEDAIVDLFGEGMEDCC